LSPPKGLIRRPRAPSGLLVHRVPRHPTAHPVRLAASTHRGRRARHVSSILPKLASRVPRAKIPGLNASVRMR
jgi:hypothetical protein